MCSLQSLSTQAHALGQSSMTLTLYEKKTLWGWTRGQGWAAMDSIQKQHWNDAVENEV
jgi:hypothetical protein